MTQGLGSRSVGTRTLRTRGLKKTVGRSVTLRAARDKGRRLGKNARCRKVHAEPAAGRQSETLEKKTA